MEAQSRLEQRYLVRTPELPKFIASLGMVVPKVYPTNKNDTLYFDNPEHELPFEHSVKARRYTNSPPLQDFQLIPEESWILELKSEAKSGGHELKQKQRDELKLSEIIALFRSQTEFQGTPLSAPLTPFIADNYERLHYLVNGDEAFRITVDNKTVYHIFVDGLRAIQIGSEGYSRIELKISNYGSQSAYTHRVSEALVAAGAIPVISKKDSAYNFVGSYLRREANQPVRQTDTEIEAKLSMNGDQQHLFNLIKQDFAAGRIEGFTLLKRFPHTLVSGKLNTYLITDDCRYLRIGAKGDARAITVKEDDEIMEDRYGLGCIIKRREIKSALTPLPENREEVGMYRKRKYFLVSSEKTGNDYCVLIDRCSHLKESLFQMEIESTLMSPSPEQVAMATREIAEITKQLIYRYNKLAPTTLTKREWLMGVASKTSA